jgi:creatinine amidohydrolase
MLPRLEWLEMILEDIAGADTSRWIAVFPTATVEQHGPRLPLGVDAFVGETYLAGEVDRFDLARLAEGSFG